MATTTQFGAAGASEPDDVTIPPLSIMGWTDAFRRGPDALAGPIVVEALAEMVRPDQRQS